MQFEVKFTGNKYFEKWRELVKDVVEWQLNQFPLSNFSSSIICFWLFYQIKLTRKWSVNMNIYWKWNICSFFQMDNGRILDYVSQWNVIGAVGDSRDISGYYGYVIAGILRDSWRIFQFCEGISFVILPFFYLIFLHRCLDWEDWLENGGSCKCQVGGQLAKNCNSNLEVDVTFSLC